MTENWDKIRSEYVFGGMTYKWLSEKYGVKYKDISQRAAVEQWKEDRKKVLSGEILPGAESGASRIRNRISRFDGIADSLLDQIEEGIKDGSVSVIGKGWKDITGALKDMRDIIGIQTELDSEEQSARIEKLKSEVKGQDGDDGVVRVVFADGLGDYAI